MKKRISALLCVCLLVSLACLPAFAAERLYVVTAKAGASLYYLATPASAKITTVKYNTVLTAVGESGGYFKTVYNGYTGWVSLDDVAAYGASDAVNSIIITAKPHKTVYYEDDAFDAAGLAVTAIYPNGSRAVVSGYTIAVPDMHSLGAKTALVSYLGKTASFDIEIIRQPLDYIEITTPPADTRVIQDSDAPDLTGMEVTAYYTDGRAPQTVTDYTVTGFDPAKIGVQTVMIRYKYDDIVAPLTLTVVPKTVVGLEITKPADKTVYYEDGLKPNLTGLELTALYDNGKRAVVAAEKAAFREPIRVGGENTIELTYAGLTATYTVTVNPLAVVGLEVVPPDLTTYVLNSEPDLSGLIVFLVYNSGNKTDTFDYAVDDIDTSVFGVQTVNVYYDTFSAAFQVRIVSDHTPGDINKDGKVSSADARLAMRYAAKLITLTPEEISIGDVTGDGKITTADARRLLRHVAKIELL